MLLWSSNIVYITKLIDTHKQICIWNEKVQIVQYLF